MDIMMTFGSWATSRFSGTAASLIKRSKDRSYQDHATASTAGVELRILNDVGPFREVWQIVGRAQLIHHGLGDARKKISNRGVKKGPAARASEALLEPPSPCSQRPQASLSIPG